MSDYFTPSQVASMIGKSPSTVRRLTGQYADKLSESANPPKGETRRYTSEDVALLQIVDQAASAGMSQDTILARLDNITLPSDLPALTTNAPQNPQDSHHTPMALIAVLDNLADHVEARNALEERLRDSEAQRHQLTRLVYIAVTVSGIALLVTLITLVAVLFT